MALGFMAGSIISKMVMDTTKWSSSIKVVKKDEGTLKGMATRLAPKFKSIGRGMTIAGAAIVAGMGAGIKAFKTFDEKMTESLAIMGDVSDEMKTAMADAATEMSGRSKFAASELAESYFFLASAGIDAAGAIKALPVVTRFAQAGAFDLARATDLLTDAQSALGLSSKDAVANQMGMVRVSDVLVKANTLANASVSQFSEALTNRAGPSMRAYGVELEEGVAVLAAFADQGVKGGEAGMQFAIVMRDLQKAALANKSAFEAAGIAVFDANGNLNNMGETIGQLEVRLSSMSAEQKKVELTTLGFQERSQAALLTLVGTSEKIKQYEKDLRSAGGITQEVSDKQLKALSAQLTIAKNNITNAGIALGQQLAPALIDISKWIAKVVGNFTAWAKENPKLFGTLTKIVAGLGLFLAVMGPIVMMIPRLVSGIGLIGKAAKMAMGPVGILTAGLAFLSERVISATKDFKSFTDILDKEAESQGRKVGWLKKTWEGLNAVTNKYVLGIDTTKLAMQAYNESIEKTNRVSTDWKGTLSGLVDFGKKVSTAYNESLTPAIEDLIPPTKALKEETKKYIDFLGDLGIKTIKEKGDRTKELEGIVEDLTAAYGRGELSLDNYKTAVKNATDEMENLGTELIETVIPQTSKWTGLLTDLPEALAKTELHDFPGKIAVQAKKATKKVETMWSKMTDGLKTQWGNMWTDFLKGTISLKSFGEAFKSFTSNILDQFLGMVGQMIAKWTLGFIDKMVSGTQTAVETVVGTFKNVTDSALNLAKGFSPTGAIASGIGAAVGTFLGGLLSGGPSGNDTRLIKDNTWAINQNLLNLHNALMVQLDVIKATTWNMDTQLNDIKLTSWNQTSELKMIRELLETGPSNGGGSEGGGGGGPLGTTVNINRISNNVNINGIMISDREYARQRLIPEFMHALKQRALKKRMQEILGIA